uniref:Atypical chemokine receptor 1 n=1 Tax=Sphenodon punctatus TaxID=8508 RepID=A0A8D0GTB4_SPHPU
MGNCVNTARRATQNFTSEDLESVLYNYSYSEEDYNDLDYGATPCHSSFCPTFGNSIPAFFATVCALGLLANAALGVALHKRPSLQSRAVLSLMALASAIFAVAMSFFAAGFSSGWSFGEGSCQVAQALWYGSLFAQGLVVAGGALQAKWSRPSWCLTWVFFAAGFALAVPAGIESKHTDGVCFLSRITPLTSWRLAHVLCCLAVFLLLPLALGTAKVVLWWQRSSWEPPVNMTWFFFFFWAPYGLAVLLDALAERLSFVSTCTSLKTLDYFLGLSEGLGILHCCCLGILLLWGQLTSTGSYLVPTKTGAVSSNKNLEP